MAKIISANSESSPSTSIMTIEGTPSVDFASVSGMRHCYVLRVFTRDGEGGNHLGVVPDVTGLTRHGMQSIAAELGFSETVFLDWREGGNPIARIFTPDSELPFAGHPLVGAAWVLTRMGPGGPDCIKCEVGDVSIENIGDSTWIHPPFGQPVSSVRGEFSGGTTPIHVSEVAMPLPYQVVELASPSEVAAMTPIGTEEMVYVWAWDEPGSRIRSRFFAGGHGIVEDPATGSAAVAFAASMRARGMTSGEVVIHQGAEMGHPSEIHLTWDGPEVRLGGRVAHDEVRVLDV